MLTIAAAGVVDIAAWEENAMKARMVHPGVPAASKEELLSRLAMVMLGKDPSIKERVRRDGSPWSYEERDPYSPTFDIGSCLEKEGFWSCPYSTCK